MSLSEQAVSFMAAAAAGNGPSALDGPPDTPEMLGRSLLRMVPGEAAPLADFLASPADPARQTALEDWLSEALGEQPGLRASMAAALTAYLRRRAAGGDVQALADLGDLLCSAGDMAGGRAAFQDAIGTGHSTWAPEAMMRLGHWLSMRGDHDGALAAYQQAIDSGRADLAGHAWFSVGRLLCRQGDLGRAKPVLQRLIDSQDPDWSGPALTEMIKVLRDEDDIDGLRAAARAAAETGNPDAAYTFVVLGEMLEERGDAAGARAAYQQAIDADWAFADDLRDKLAPPPEDDSEDESLPADLPPQFHPDNLTRTGLDVIDHGLPPLPEELSYQMAIPVAYWVASQCAVVLFLRFLRHRRERNPMILHVTYARTGAGWTRNMYSSGTGFGLDPIAEPGGLRALGGQPMTGGGSMHYQEQPPPGYPAAVVTGLVAPAVTQIALIQDGHEDRRPLQSHFGAWVVCTERLGSFQVAGLASDGTVLATLDYPLSSR